MGDYDLSRLNTREFEHLVQALALETIGLGVTPFGDGPDGGREATFYGRADYPSQTSPWDGYIVLQAKFRARSSPDPASNATWLAREVQKELQALHTRSPIPEYLIIASNVVLSAVQEVGGKDRLNRLLQHSADTGELRGWAVWDYDVICRLLDRSSSVRRVYRGFITPGDVLDEMMNFMHIRAVDFGHSASVFLQTEFFADRYVRLEQAGHTPEHKIPIERVFVDLPASRNAVTGVTTEVPAIFKLVEALLIEGDQVLRPTSLLLRPEHHRRNADGTLLGRTVVVGGPGQGKTTVGQFICQLHRAALLRGRPPHLLEAGVLESLDNLDRQRDQLSLTEPGVRRFPFRVSFERFASTLAVGTTRSLLGYLALSIGERTDRHFEPEDVRRWLAIYPSIIVLDGLDEVPSTSNRLPVLAAVRHFTVEMTDSDADVQIIATTRPQGYNAEFGPNIYAHYHLATLSRENALEYGSKLVATRYSDDPERMVRITDRLGEACDQVEIARLMSTPLQVTIMATLVDRIGRPPTQRWRLFQQYYEVVYARETERDIPASDVLRHHKSSVDAIHHQIGLLLQVRGEEPGGGGTWLSRSRFENVVTERLKSEGFEGAELALQVRLIVDAALNRLVFIVGLEINHIGFEIRSLQEYSAAEALMQGSDALIRDRLRRIAPLPYWRNVFLFAAGQCFGNRQHLRDSIVVICEELDENPTATLTGALHAGATLALDVLEDGASRSQPRYSRALARVALGMLEGCSVSTLRRLTANYDDTMQISYHDALALKVAVVPVQRRVGAWVLLQMLMEKGVEWPRRLYPLRWPKSGRRAWLLLEGMGEAALHPPFDHELRKVVPTLHPSTVGVFLEALVQGRATFKDTPWVQDFAALLFPEPAKIESNLQFGSKTIVGRINAVVSSEGFESLLEQTFPRPEWQGVVASARFRIDPTNETLAAAIESSHASLVSDSQLAAWVKNCPWPLTKNLRYALTEEDLAILALRARSGELGTLASWSDDERCWRAQPIGPEQYNPGLLETLPSGRRLEISKYPLIAADLEVGIPELLDAVIEFQGQLPHGRLRTHLAQLIVSHLSAAARSQSSIRIKPEPLRRLLTESGEVFDMALLDSLHFATTPSDDWLNFFDWACRRPQRVRVAPVKWQHTERVAKHFQLKPLKTGLRAFLAYLKLAGVSVPYRDGFRKRSIDDGHQRVADIVFSLADGEQLPRLGTFVSTLLWLGRSDPVMLLDVLRFLRGLPQTAVRLEKHLLALRARLDGANREPHQKVVDILNDLLLAQASGLQMRRMWLHLGLPEELAPEA